MDNVPGRLELFIAPFSTLLQKLLAADFAQQQHEREYHSVE